MGGTSHATMDIYQIRTFLAVAREGSITRAAEHLYLSQPAISAHIKSLEEELELVLFERTPRGMSLTPAGVQLFAKAEQLMSVHHELLDDARRIKGTFRGTLRLGLAGATRPQWLGQLLARLSTSHPALEINLQYATSVEVLQGLRSGMLDAGILADAGVDGPELARIELYRFGIFLAAAPGMVANAKQPVWSELAALPWVCPGPSTCCGLAAEHVFHTYGFRPGRIFGTDHESTSRALISGGVGIGFLHEATVRQAEANGEVEILGSGPQQTASMVFAWLAHRSAEPLLNAVVTAVQQLTGEPTPFTVRPRA